MLKFRAWIISPLLCLPLRGQDQEVLPVPGPPPAADMIQPVPAPEIPLGSLGATAPTMPKNLLIDNYGGGPIEWNNAAETLTYRGPGIKLTGDNGLEIYADRAFVDIKSETATMEGNVSVYQGNILQRGESVVYDAKSKNLDVRGLRASLDPVLLEAGKFHVEQRGGKNVYVGEDAGITTHDVEEPNYWLRAKKTTIYPGEKVVFNDLRVFAGDVPVFWLPYLSQPLNAELGYHFYPGTRSNWGPFLMNTYGIMLGGDYNAETGENENQWLLSRWHFDIRTRRGIGTGVDLVDTRVENQDEISGFSAYYLNDLDPQASRSGIPRGFVNEDRYRIELKHRQTLPIQDGADWRLDTNLTLLSDEHYLEDFEQDRYRTDPAPDNTIGVYRRADDSLLSAYTRLRLNEFYRADTRLPEVSFDQARRPIFGLPLLHEGNTSLGFIGEKAADVTSSSILIPLSKMTASDPAAQPLLAQLGTYERQLAKQMLQLPLGDPRRSAIQTQLIDSSYLRFNTYQELSMPFKLGNFLTLAPQAGIGYSRYDMVEGPVDDFDRTYLHAGAEASLKLSKDFGDFRKPDWGLDGIKHILEPYTVWSVISTNDFDPTGPMVDRLTPTTRPRPLDPTRFTAVDDLEDWNVVRLGARNRLLTQRDNQSFEWLYLDTYIDAFINDPEAQRDLSNLYNDVTWRPVPWMAVDLQSQTPIATNGSGFEELNTRIRFLPTENFEFTLGYRVLNGHPVLEDSNRIELQTYTRINENWGFGTAHGYEMDDNTLEVEQYTVHRDLGNWVAGFGLSHRNNRLKEEYGVVFSFTLKDFPSTTLPFRLDAE